MDDSDILQDELPATRARAGSKFLPRAKLKPRKESVTLVPCDRREEVIIQSSSGLDNELTSSRGLSIDSSTTLGAEVSLKNNYKDSSQTIVTKEDDVGVIDVPSSDVPVSFNDHVSNSIPTIWSKDIDFGLDPFDDVANQVARNGQGGSTFEPKTKNKIKEEISSSILTNLPNVMNEEAAILANMGPNATNSVEPNGVVDEYRSSQLISPSHVALTDSLLSGVVIPNVCDDSNSTFGRPVEENADLYSAALERLDQFLAESSNIDECIGIDDDRTGTQEAGAYLDVETQDSMADATIVSGAYIPSDPCSSELPTIDTSINLTEYSNMGVKPSGDVPGTPREVTNNRKRKVCPVPNPSQKSKRPFASDGSKETGKMTKQSREKVNSPNLDDGHQGRSCNDDDAISEPYTSSAIDEDKGDDDEYDVGSASPKRRRSTRSKKTVGENEKPPRKRKTANEKQAKKFEKAKEASDQPAMERHNKATEASDQPAMKKFHHSTRRKRRFVDESLLHKAEDDIDYAKLALKDIILLADYKERIAKKETKTSKTPLNNQSTRNNFPDENAHNEENSFASEQEQGFTDDQESAGAQPISFCLNYQSYMDREPRARWTKQDTELFYGAIQQFGPDFSLVQQLFPGKSRHQIKLKFKNEERRYPLKLSQALASRNKDHFYYEKVIEQLQQAAGQSEHQSNGDVTMDSPHDSMHEESELASETNVETTKYEQDDNVAVKDQDAYVAEDSSALKSDESDDDGEVYKGAF